MLIRRTVLDAIAAHARLDNPRECCGLLIGAEGEIVEAVPTTNVSAEPLRHYEVSPAEHVAQMRRCRDLASGATPALNIVGVYHSHPHSAPRPSPTDLDQSFEEYLYVMAGPADGSAPLEIRAYRVRAGRFEEVELLRS